MLLKIILVVNLARQVKLDNNTGQLLLVDYLN